MILIRCVTFLTCLCHLKFFCKKLLVEHEESFLCNTLRRSFTFTGKPDSAVMFSVPLSFSIHLRKSWLSHSAERLTKCTGSALGMQRLAVSTQCRSWSKWSLAWWNSVTSSSLSPKKTWRRSRGSNRKNGGKSTVHASGLKQRGLFTGWGNGPLGWALQLRELVWTAIMWHNHYLSRWALSGNLLSACQSAGVPPSGLPGYLPLPTQHLHMNCYSFKPHEWGWWSHSSLPARSLFRRCINCHTQWNMSTYIVCQSLL